MSLKSFCECEVEREGTAAATVAAATAIQNGGETFASHVGYTAPSRRWVSGYDEAKDEVTLR